MVGSLIAFAGGIGSGKSTIARAVSERLAVPVHSIDDDKRIVGAANREFPQWIADGVPFPDEFRSLVYDRALTRLADLSGSHPSVIVEETFHRALLRRRFFGAAANLFGQVLVIEVAVAPEVAMAHLEQRAQSESGHMAGRAMFEAFAATADPLTEADFVVENNGDVNSAVDAVCEFLELHGLSTRER